MSSPRFRPGHLRYGLGLLAVLLALAGRLATGSLVVDAQTLRDVAALLETTIRCESGPGASVPSPDRSRQHGSGHDIAALEADLLRAPPTLTPPPMLPPGPEAIPPRIAPDHLTRQPNMVPTGAALPRGPPIPA
jgi:hypothetical protein